MLNAEQQHFLGLLGDVRHCVESLAVAMDSDLRNVQRLLTPLELAGMLRQYRVGVANGERASAIIWARGRGLSKRF